MPAALSMTTRAVSKTSRPIWRTHYPNCATIRPGRLIVGANESTSLYLLGHIERYRRLYPKVKVQVRRSFSSKIPSQLIDGDLELGVISYDPEDERLHSMVIYIDHLAFVVSPQHRFATRGQVSISELGMETFIAHNVLSPYRDVVLKEFQRHKVQLNMDVEMPTVETIRLMVQRNEGVAFLPHMCVEQRRRPGRPSRDQGEGAHRRPQNTPGLPRPAQPEPRRKGVFGASQGGIIALLNNSVERRHLRVATLRRTGR